MKFLFHTRFWMVLAVLSVLALATTSAVSAHERRDVGQYQFVVGFIVEPAFEGLKNGVDLRISLNEEPVEGLEETLRVEITHVPSGTAKTLDLRTIFRDPGHYTADLIPTAPGIYQMRIFGTLEGTEVDETFISRGGGGGFGDVESSYDLQFPVSLPEIREFENAVRGAQDTAQQAQDAAIQADGNASNASTLAIVGIVLGSVGIAFGAGGVIIGMRRR